MTSLASIKKQIAALEAEAARITKAEAAAAIAKIKELMSTFGLTAEHLGLAAVRGKRVIAKKPAPKRVGAGTAKYADPKTGKTWTGFGRAPAWIASAKSRDAFLVDKSGIEVITPAASKKAAAKPVKSSKPAKKTSTAKTARAAKKAAAPAVASKKAFAAKKAMFNKAAAKKGTAKVAVAKSAPKKKPSKGAAASQVTAEAPVTAAA